MGGAAIAQKSDMNAIKSTITAFAKAGDNQDVSALEPLLDANYRVVMNQLFGSTEVSVMPRAVYIEKIRAKEFGGDTRTLTFENVQVNGNTAVAQVLFKGQKMSFNSLLTLTQNAKGDWQLVQDCPVIVK